MSSIIVSEYNGIATSFTEDGWFNATEVAEKFGKNPYEWLRLPATIEYLEAIERRYGKIPYVKTSKARKDRGGGTWLHPKLAIRFAQWLSIDFAVWCDEQISNILAQKTPHHDWKRLRHASSASNKIMNAVLDMIRKGEGKESEAHHYSNEARLVNWALTGEFKGVDRESLSIEELDMLAKLEAQNAVLIGGGIEYKERKKLLEAFSSVWREDHPATLSIH